MNDELTTVGSDRKVAVRYIGSKPVKYDNVCLTRTVWHGSGDVQLVPIGVAAKLARFSKVWEVLSESGEPSAGAPALDSVVPDMAVPETGRPTLKLPARKRP